MERLSNLPIPQEVDPRPDAAEQLAQLPALWDTIYCDQSGFVGLFSGTRLDRRLKQPRDVFFRYPDAIPSALAWVQTEAERSRELYHCSHLLVRPRRRKGDAALLFSLYADVDLGDVAALPFTPSALVESSPGRLQAYWRLTRPVPPRTGEELNHRLAIALGADKTGWDLTQLLRLPGTRNHKYGEAPLVRLIRLTDERIDPAKLVRELSRLQAPVVEPQQFHTGPREGSTCVGSAPPVRFSGRAQMIWQGLDVKRTLTGAVDRSASLIRIARVLYDAGVAVDAIPTVLAERDASLGWQKYTDRRDAVRQYQAIVDLVQRGAKARHGR